MPFEKTIKRQVLPHAPSPTMTSLRLISLIAAGGRWVWECGGREGEKGGARRTRRRGGLCGERGVEGRKGDWGGRVLRERFEGESGCLEGVERGLKDCQSL